MRRGKGLPPFVIALIVFALTTFANAQTWISAVNFTTTTSTATITWTTAVPSDSIVDYGATAAYGSSTALAAARVTAHSVTISGLQAGTAYHFRARSCDSDGVSVTGLDYVFTTQKLVSVAVSPTSATVASGGTQQLTATVSNATNTAVTWSTTAGTVSAAGLFTAPTVTADTTVTVKATSVADTSKSASATITVKAPAPALVVSPMSLSFSATQGGTAPAPASLSISNAGSGTLTFTASSDQTWLAVSPASGTAPQTVQATPSIGGLVAGVYTAHITITAAGATNSPAIINVTLTVGAASTSYTLFATKVPKLGDFGADLSVELGTKFTADYAGYVTAIRFYKSAANTGTHTGNLWDSTGKLLATVTFTNETASGWQQQTLSTPVAVAASTSYIVSYHTSVGHEAIDAGFFNAKYDNAPLHAPVNAGVCAYGTTSKFPTPQYPGENYYVDVVFAGTAPPPPAPTPVLSVSSTALSFSATQGGSNPAASSVSITNTGTGTLTFTASSDASWLTLSAASGTAPQTLQVSAVSSGLAAGTYTGHITVTASGVSGSPKTVTVTLTVAPVVVQHSVALSWKASTSANVVSYSLYRASMQGGPYSLVASTISGLSYADAAVQSGVTYYYVATAVDETGKESAYSAETVAAVP